jgi:hypothetical protein
MATAKSGGTRSLRTATRVQPEVLRPPSSDPCPSVRLRIPPCCTVSYAALLTSCPSLTLIAVGNAEDILIDNIQIVKCVALSSFPFIPLPVLRHVLTSLHHLSSPFWSQLVYQSTRVTFANMRIESTSYDPEVEPKNSGSFLPLPLSARHPTRISLTRLRLSSFPSTCPAPICCYPSSRYVAMPWPLRRMGHLPKLARHHSRLLGQRRRRLCFVQGSFSPLLPSLSHH